MTSLLLGVLVGLIASAGVAAASGVSMSTFIWSAVTLYLILALALWGVVFRLLLRR